MQNSFIQFVELARSTDDALFFPAMSAALLERTELPKCCTDGTLDVVAHEVLTYKDQEQLLVVCKMPPAVAERCCPSLQVLEIKKHLRDDLGLTTDKDRDLQFWPLNDYKVSAVILTAEERMVASAGQESGAELTSNSAYDRFMKALYFLHILLPKGGGDMIRALNEHYGPDVAFAFHWLLFHNQNLWLLMPLVLVCEFWSIGPGNVSGPPEHPRLYWQITKCLWVVWGAFIWWRQDKAMTKAEARLDLGHLGKDDQAISGRHDENIGFYGHFWRWSAILLFVVPLMMAYLLLVNAVLLGVLQLHIFLVYDWGDCVRLQCRDAQVLHGFWGWAAEVGVDMLLAIVFELFFALGPMIARLLANLRNFKFRTQKRIVKESLVVVLACVERLGTFAIFGILVVPQWVEPTGKVANPYVDCSQFLFGKADFFCLQKQLPLDARRAIFLRSLRGPFMVAPFVAILMKAVVPAASEALERATRTIKCFTRMRCAPVRGLARIAALIFAYDSDNVGFLRFIWFGWPWKRKKDDLETEEERAAASSNEKERTKAAIRALKRQTLMHRTPLDLDEEEEGKASEPASPLRRRTTVKIQLVDQEDESLTRPPDHIKEALEQGARKVFNAQEMLLEFEMNMIWILFFGPLYPIGVCATLVAAHLSVKRELSRLCLVKRRSLPEPDGIGRSLQRGFLPAAILASTGWSAALSMLTYNDELWKLGAWKNLLCVGLSFWIIVSFGAVLVHADKGCIGLVPVVGLSLIAIGFIVVDFKSLMNYLGIAIGFVECLFSSAACPPSSSPNSTVFQGAFPVLSE